jgi:hypothetical protein
MADCPLYGLLDGSEREVRLLNIRGFITHGIADGIMLSIKGGSKAMRLPPRPARCVYLSRTGGDGEPTRGGREPGGALVRKGRQISD